MSASFAIRASKASGAMIICSTPSVVSLSLVAGLSIALTISACILATTSRGVCFGTNAPTQKSKSESGTPASIVVGTSGSADARLELDTASASTLPSRISGSAGVIGQK